ncbi:MAG: hypothetical protein OXC91_02240, partial [Rhodobacteraceae bacterium]|nr:hypothetical protein [Paracoccaceae bacterium]
GLGGGCDFFWSGRGFSWLSAGGWPELGVRGEGDDLEKKEVWMLMIEAFCGKGLGEAVAV